jgi:transcriptional regulator with XRE-family HTH domain
VARVLGADEGAFLALARCCRPTYTLYGSGPGVSQAHRDLALLLWRYWGRLPDVALSRAAAIAEAAPAPRGPASTEPSVFGAWLQRARLNASPQLYQPDVAAAIGVARSYVAMVEGGTKGASWPAETIQRVAELFGAPLDEVEELVARSQQAYRLMGSEAGLPHRALASVLARRWRELPKQAAAQILGELERAAGAEAVPRDGSKQ